MGQKLIFPSNLAKNAKFGPGYHGNRLTNQLLAWQ